MLRYFRLDQSDGLSDRTTDEHCHPGRAVSWLVKNLITYVVIVCQLEDAGLSACVFSHSPLWSVLEQDARAPPAPASTALLPPFGKYGEQRISQRGSMKHHIVNIILTHSQWNRSRAWGNQESVLEDVRQLHNYLHQQAFVLISILICWCAVGRTANAPLDDWSWSPLESLLLRRLRTLQHMWQ